ncbi:MAG: DNA-methyltransferase [Candidatus Hodarchaeales archaeon]
MKDLPCSEKFDGQIVHYKSSENMNEVTDNSIDVIITSPPYNRRKIYSSDGNEAQPYDDDKDEDSYHDFLKKIWKECYRVLSPEGLFFLNIGDAAGDQGKSEKVVNLAVDSGFTRLQTIIWIKSFLGRGHYTPSGRDRRLNNIWENIYILVKDKKSYRLDPKAVGIPYADKSNIGRYGKSDIRDAGNIWFIPYTRTTGSTLKKGHDAPFPIELPYKCIKLAGSSVKTVLDPFGGTCSTLAAARMLKHYELTIRYLVNTLNRLESLEKRPVEELFTFTKKEQATLSIIQSIVKQLDLDIPLITEYMSRLEQLELDNEAKKSTHSITDYFKS